MVNKKRRVHEGTVEEEMRWKEEQDGIVHVHNSAPVHDDNDEKFKELTEDEVWVWCMRYNNVEAMEAYMMNERNEPRTQERFVASLAKAALLKDTPVALRAEFGSLYQWI